ncbi:hypothetical protein J2129_001963 [Methanofollis sp. W23]|uniref:hypothetical protein n=1 Tax=Methanofollis sp. W23 TaxID=2817849 RepID=UPI001AE3EACA|nr:hypothetical protein [Methanofollis sp. W23]MBP2146509.1 hypothetical protein [Methanofollis sp. W23]
MKWFSCTETASAFLILLAVPVAATGFTGWEGNVTLDPETNITLGEHETWGEAPDYASSPINESDAIVKHHVHDLLQRGIQQRRE